MSMDQKFEIILLTSGESKSWDHDIFKIIEFESVSPHLL